MQLDGGGDRQVRALLAREPADVHQTQHLDAGARPVRTEGLEVDARAGRGTTGQPAASRDVLELVPGVVGGDHDGVDAAHEQAVEQADGDLGRGVEAGAQGEHVVEPLVREQHRADAAAPCPARDWQQGELVAQLDRGGLPLLEHVGDPPRLDDQAVAAADPRCAQLDDVAQRCGGAWRPPGPARRAGAGSPPSTYPAPRARSAVRMPPEAGPTKLASWAMRMGARSRSQVNGRRSRPGRQRGPAGCAR